MNEIMPVIEIPLASDFVEEDASAYVEGYAAGAQAQRDADRKWVVEWIERIAVVRAPFMSPFNSPTAPPYLELDLKEFLVFKGALK